MAQIQSPEVYADSQQVTATRMNNMVNGAILLPGAVTEQAALGTTIDKVNDLFVIHDFSTSSLRSVTASDITGAGADVKTSLVEPLSGGTGTITLQATGSGNLWINGTLAGFTTIATPGNIIVQGGTGSITMPEPTDTAKSIRLYGSYPILFDSYSKFNTTDAVKLPTGTTAQRPASPNQGDIRYNSTTLVAEVYNGSTWEAVGGGPFDATGGNKIIAPDAVATTPTSATFTSVDGESVVVTSAGHSVTPGQVVRIVTAVSGYSGDWTVLSANTNDFTYVMTTTAAPNSGSCTYKKAGNYKVHIFTSSGTFVAGTKASHVEVLVVGGGGGGVSGGNYNGGGGGGAVCYYPYYSINASQTITVTVGSGGAVNTNGSASVFGTITAGGGNTGSGGTGGASGNGYSLSPSKNGGSPGSGGVSNGFQGGGGGGAGSVGQNGAVGGSGFPEGGDGGDGLGSNITGISATYGGGGAAGGRYQGVGFASATASNGGGNPSSAGLANSGGGGGGAPYSGSAGAGGSGIVIVRYPYWV